MTSSPEESNTQKQKRFIYLYLVDSSVDIEKCLISKEHINGLIFFFFISEISNKIAEKLFRYSAIVRAISSFYYYIITYKDCDNSSPWNWCIPSILKNILGGNQYLIKNMRRIITPFILFYFIILINFSSFFFFSYFSDDLFFSY